MESAYTKLKKDMGAHAQEQYPLECVGIITKDFIYVPCNNISSSPKTTFYLDPKALIAYDNNIWGIFHSHPGEDNPIPSSEDKVSAAFAKYKFIVGFGNKFNIYWVNKALDALMFEPFEEKHLVITNKSSFNI